MSRPVAAKSVPSKINKFHHLPDGKYIATQSSMEQFGTRIENRKINCRRARCSRVLNKVCRAACPNRLNESAQMWVSWNPHFVELLVLQDGDNLGLLAQHGPTDPLEP